MSYEQPTLDQIEERRAELAPLDSWNERAYMALYALLCAWKGIPKTHLDLGSGTGAMVNMGRRVGTVSIGVDVINGPEHWFIKHDLSKPLHLLYPSAEGLVFAMPDEFVHEDLRDGVHHRVNFDLVTCIEVAEHLPASSAPLLCDTIKRHMAPGSLLVFSAAPPGQAGEHHVNCQPAQYWRSLFHARGVSYRADMSRELSHLWGWAAGPMQWLAANVQVFDTL